MKVRSQLSLAFTGIILLVLCGSSMMVRFVGSRYLPQVIQFHRQALAEAGARFCAKAMEKGSMPLLRDYLEAMRTFPAVLDVYISGRDGKIIMLASNIDPADLSLHRRLQRIQELASRYAALGGDTKTLAAMGEHVRVLMESGKKAEANAGIDEMAARIRTKLSDAANPDYPVLSEADFVGQPENKRIEWLGGYPLVMVGAPIRIGSETAGRFIIGFHAGLFGMVSDAFGREIFHSFLQLGAAILILGLIGSIVLADFMTRPIRTLVQGAQRIGRGDFSTRLLIPSSEELGVLARQLNDTANELAVLDQLKDDFIHNVSHDLRSPMSAIKMYVDFMLNADEDREKLIPRHRQWLETIMGSATRLDVFVTNILDAAKMKAGRMDYRLEPVDARKLLAGVHGLFAMAAARQQIGFDLEVPAELPPLSADPVRLEQAVMNLVSNALKFTKPGGSAAIRARRLEDQVEIEVSDTGMGISKAELEHLFERFRQIDAGRSASSMGIKGTGLGLYVTKRAVEAMGGSIRVESEAGKGSRFVIAMPAAGKQP